MADIGITLREARLRARVEISDAEARTKIRARYLRAMENEEWELLPGPVYAKSFLRTYGDFLGLDSRLLVDEYKRRYERPSDQDMRPIAVRSPERRRARRRVRIPPWAVIGGVLVAVAAALYVVGRYTGNTTNTTPPVTAKRSPPRARHPVHHAAHRPTAVTLSLVPTGQVYVCLVDGNGKTLIPGRIFAPGETIPSQRAGKLLLTLGNASVKMKVNGKDVNVSTSPTSIGFLLLPSGTHPLPAAQQPTCT
ncbi:MAG: helix-turn-helix domain-containing protein [Solirubrobacterales bacterium]|nr:helix-turn-helix domain-containing protein [Solirubrobacterales bacterium]MBV9715648.1 helix-turn-helix domain-containing protein [Solirubrobacterales bacterium]